jgi:hypothetical protein
MYCTMEYTTSKRVLYGVIFKIHCTQNIYVVYNIYLFYLYTSVWIIFDFVCS